MGAAEYRALSDAMERASEMAKREVEALVDGLDAGDADTCRDALLALFPAIVRKWGGVAALAAAEYYEGERAAAMGGGFSAELALPVEDGAMRAKVRYAAGCLYERDGGG